jgi:hypothetical protein
MTAIAPCLPVSGISVTSVSRRQTLVAHWKIWAFNHPKLSAYLVAIAGWRLILSIHDLYSGIGYAVGPPFFYASPSFDLIKSYGIPIWMYGVLMIAAGIGILDWHGERFRWASWLAGTVWALWALCLFVSTWQGVIGGWSGPVNWAVIAALQFRIASRRPKR